MIRVALVDRHEIVRAGVEALLSREADVEVVSDPADADVIVLEPVGQGEAPVSSIPIVVLTGDDTVAAAADAMRRGVAGYVPKDAAPKQLLRAVRMAAEGLTYLEPQLGARLAAAREAVPELTERELDVLRLIAAGHTNRQIAARLHRSVRTVEGHRARIQSKVGRTTRAELVELVANRGL